MEEKPGVSWLINLNATDYRASYMTLVFNLSELQFLISKRKEHFILSLAMNAQNTHFRKANDSYFYCAGQRVNGQTHANESQEWEGNLEASGTRTPPAKPSRETVL